MKELLSRVTVLGLLMGFSTSSYANSCHLVLELSLAQKIFTQHVQNLETTWARDKDLVMAAQVTAAKAKSEASPRPQHPLSHRPPTLLNLNQLRGALFALQAYGRFYSAASSAEKNVRLLQDLRLWSKIPESLLGKYEAYTNEYKKKLKEDAHPATLENLARLADREREILVPLLLQEMRKASAMTHRVQTQLNWDEYKNHMAYVIKAFRQLHERLLERMTEIEEAILKPDLGRENLELGLHKLRREMRWYAIYLQMFVKIVGLRPITLPLTVEEQRLVDIYQNHKYGLPMATPDTLIFVDALPFFRLSDFIDRFGVIKDQIEELLDFALGLTADMKENRALRLHAQGLQLFREYKKADPITLLIESIGPR